MQQEEMTTDVAAVKPPVLSGEILTPVDREHCLARVRGALLLLYAAGEQIGSRRLQGAALDALAAARGLNG